MILSMLSNIEQTRRSLMPKILFMEPQKKFRFEASNPNRSTEWEPLFEISEEELSASLKLRDELNEVNSRVVVRIVDTQPPQRFD